MCLSATDAGLGTSGQDDRNGRRNMRLQWRNLVLCTAALGWLATCAGLGAAPASAAAAPHAVAALTGHHRISPFGLGAPRARHVPEPRTRPQAVPRVVPTEWVSNTVAVGNNTSCAAPGYPTISAALSAVTTAGTIIKVCAGTYDEQLAITQSVVTADSAAEMVGYPGAAQLVL